MPHTDIPGEPQHPVSQPKLDSSNPPAQKLDTTSSIDEVELDEILAEYGVKRSQAWERYLNDGLSFKGKKLFSDTAEQLKAEAKAAIQAYARQFAEGCVPEKLTDTSDETGELIKQAHNAAIDQMTANIKENKA